MTLRRVGAELTQRVCRVHNRQHKWTLGARKLQGKVCVSERRKLKTDMRAKKLCNTALGGTGRSKHHRINTKKSFGRKEEDPGK